MTKDAEIAEDRIQLGWLNPHLRGHGHDTTMKAIFLAQLIAVAMTMAAGVASAQYRTPSYQPAKPTLSPYLYLTRPQVGYYPNYQMFVQPYRIQERTNQVQQTQITNIDRQVQQQQQTLLKNQPSSVRPTGTASVYGNVSHYYSSGAGTVGGRQGRPAGRR